jgi:flagellar protein FliS
MDGALERISRARGRLEHGECCEKSSLLRSAVQILGELRSNLDLSAGGAMVANLDDLCEYMCRQLITGARHNRIANLDEVSHLLREVRAAWVTMPSHARTGSPTRHRV